MVSPTRLQLLGPIQVRQDGRIVRGFESRKALALLGYLAARDRPVARAHLVDLLWPDLTEARGRANLSGALHNLTTLLPGRLAADRHVIAFQSPPADWVDVAAFEVLVAKGTPNALAAAAELYQDDFMTDMYVHHCPEFDIWLTRQRADWRARMAEVLGALIRHHAGRDDHTASIGFARRLLALEPWLEDAHRQLMVLLASSGQRAAALAQFKACQRDLMAELAVEPAPETVALYRQLLAGGAAAPRPPWLVGTQDGA